jgi:hypothetical protein
MDNDWRTLCEKEREARERLRRIALSDDGHILDTPRKSLIPALYSWWAFAKVLLEGSTERLPLAETLDTYNRFSARLKVGQANIETARLVWEKAGLAKSKPLDDPRADELGEGICWAVDHYRMAAEPRPPHEREHLESIRDTAAKLISLIEENPGTRARLEREFPFSYDGEGLDAVSVIKEAATRALIARDSETGEEVERRRGGAILEDKFKSPDRLFVRRLARAYQKAGGKPGVSSEPGTENIRGRFVRFVQESARLFDVPVPGGKTIKRALKDGKSEGQLRRKFSAAVPLSTYS